MAAGLSVCSILSIFVIFPLFSGHIVQDRVVSGWAISQLPVFKFSTCNTPAPLASQEQAAATAPTSPNSGELLLPKALTPTLQTRYILKPAHNKYLKGHEPPKGLRNICPCFNHWTGTSSNPKSSLLLNPFFPKNPPSNFCSDYSHN